MFFSHLHLTHGPPQKPSKLKNINTSFFNPRVFSTRKKKKKKLHLVAQEDLHHVGVAVQDRQTQGAAFLPVAL